MTLQEIEKIHSVIAGQIAAVPSFKLSRLRRVFEENDIDCAIYSSVGPKSWLKDYFPEFLVDGTNGQEVIILSSRPMEAMATIIRNEFRDGDSILLSGVPNLLRAHGYDYRDYANGKKLSEWIPSQFREFKLKEGDPNRLERIGDYPEPMQEGTDEEIRQMHAAAFMNWWSQNVKIFRAYNEQLTSESAIKTATAHHFAFALLGVPDAVIFSEQEQRAAFWTGCNATDGDPIYCVLMPNFKNEDGTKQNWMLSSFCTPHDETENGEWLHRMTTHASDGATSFSVLKDIAADMANHIFRVAELLKAYYGSVAAGKIPSYKIGEEIQQFESKTDEYIGCYQRTFQQPFPSDLTMTDLLQQLEEKNAMTQQLQLAVEQFCQMADAVDALFKKHHIPVGEESTPLKDQREIREKYSQMPPEAFIRSFEERLQAYRTLKVMLAAPACTEEIEEMIESSFCPHFGEVSYRNATRVFVNYEEYDEALVPVDSVERILTACRVHAESSTDSDEGKMSAEELFDAVLTCGKDLILLSRYATRVFPDNQAQQMLLLGQLAQLREYLRANPDEPGFEQMSPDILTDMIHPAELTCFAAAERLRRVIGDYDGLAEKYYLLALGLDTEQSADRLLDIYRNRGDKKRFREILSRFADERRISPENQTFFLSLLREESESNVVEYANQYRYLYYLPDSAEVLLSLSDDALSAADKEAIRRRVARLNDWQTLNPIEKALIDGDISRICALVQDSESLMSLGYTDAQRVGMERLTENPQSVMRGHDAYSIGCRLYAFQQNTHSLAERYLWKGIASDRGLIGLNLMLLLSEESRFSECCLLYECFKKQYAANPQCRRLYFTARLRSVGAVDSVDREYILENLQDVLAEMSDDSVRKVVDNLRQQEMDTDSSFYSDLWQLYELLSDNLLRSVVLQDRTMREYTTASLMKDFAVEKEYVADAAGLYRSENYAHGGEAWSIASRIFAFCGPYKNAAEAFAEFALPHPLAVSLLCEIALSLRDETMFFRLMRDYPAVRSKYRSDYLNGLFRRQLYADYLAEISHESCEDDAIQALQYCVAALRENPSSSPVLPDLQSIADQSSLDRWFLVWGGLLLSVLTDAGRQEDVEAILFVFFDGWLSRFPADRLGALLTCDGGMPAGTLEDIQRHALREHQYALAVYLYRVLRVGESAAMSETADAYMREELARADAAESDEEKLRILLRIRTIFGDAGAAAVSGIPMLKIRRILMDAGVPAEEAAQRIVSVMEEETTQSLDTGELLALIGDSAVRFDAELCRRLALLADGTEEAQMVLRYFYRLLREYPEEAGEDYARFVVSRTLSALTEGYFPKDMLEEAYRHCRGVAEQKKNVESCFCLYYLEKAGGRDDIAKLLLRCLSDVPSGSFGEALYGVFEAELSARWGHSLPRYLTLFKEVVEQQTIDAIFGYISDAGYVMRLFRENAVPYDMPDFEDQENESVLSETESDGVICDLYLNDKNPATWRRVMKLPLQDSPLCFAKIQIMAAERGGTQWEDSIQYCDKYDLKKWQLFCLTEWSQTASLWEMGRLRKFLEDRLKKTPDYLERLHTDDKTKATLLTLAQNVCERISDADSNRHSSYCSIVVIAAKTQLPEALVCMEKAIGEELMTEHPNLLSGLVASLLLDGRLSEAQEWLRRLVKVTGHLNYRPLIVYLSGLAHDALEAWVNRAENRRLLGLVGPDGNTPNIESVVKLTYSGITEHREAETAYVLQKVLELFPGDRGSYNCLYDVCCTRFEGCLSYLHFALRGLTQYEPTSGQQSYYRRDRRQYVRMLAALDAVLIAQNRTAETGDYFQTYSGTVEFYRHVSPAAMTVAETADIVALQDRLRSELGDEMTPAARDRLCEAYISCITGNWMALLSRLWTERSDDWQKLLHLTVSPEVRDFGFARSILRVAADMESEERSAFLEWLGSCPLSKKAGGRGAQVVFAQRFVACGALDRLIENNETDFLQLPFEDYSLVADYFSPLIKSFAKQKPDRLYDLVFAMSGFICEEGFQKDVANVADKFFQRSKDALASQLYKSLLDIRNIFGLVEYHPGNDISPIHEKYESRYRLTAAFAGEKNARDKIGSPAFHVWSCINLALTLAFSETRADELERLATYLAEHQRALVRAMCRAMNPYVSPEEKKGLPDTLSGDLMKAYFCYAVKNRYNPRAANPILPPWLRREVADAYNSRYLELARSLPGDFAGLNPKHFLLVGGTVKKNIISRQKDPFFWNAEEPVPEAAGETVSPEAPSETAAAAAGVTEPLTIPFYAEGLFPAEEGTDWEALREEYEKLPARYLDSDVAHRRELSEKMLRCRLNGSEKQLADALLLYGCDVYFVDAQAENYDAAIRVAFSLAAIVLRGETGGSGYREARQLLSDALYSLLRSFDSLRALYDSYARDKALYGCMLGCVEDPLRNACVQDIYRVLDDMIRKNLFAGARDMEDLRRELSGSYRKLEEISGNQWMELKNTVQRLINEEISSLDRRPVLQVTVNNTGTQSRSGFLYGVVKNVGQVAASEIVLQAHYDRGESSRQYSHPCLSPGSEAVFQIEYACGDRQKSLGYLINLSYRYDDQTVSSVVCKDSLTIGETPKPDYELASLGGNGLDFYVDEKGRLTNDVFVGRSEETKKLRCLLSGRTFAECQSALVYGIRRSGKSTLLNYFVKYMETNYPEILCIQYNCQSLAEENVIQYLFVDFVLDAIEPKIGETAATVGWKALREKWYSPAYCADENPERLVQFYPEVRRVLGDERGIYLIVDEVDRLFEKVEIRSKSDLDGLFNKISALLELPECRAAIHFVFCGSNWVIRYDLRGEKKNQFRQRFGQNVIQVGKLPKEDAKEVVRRPYRKYPGLTLTEEALDWIYNYTGGLVWHTRVLGNAAVERVKKLGRSVVYPYDVETMLPAAIDEQWCKHFLEGVESGNEYELVDAMQSLAAKRDEYVSVSRLCEVLHWERIEVQRCFQLLKELKYFAADPLNPDERYRFEMEIYRRYFRTLPSRLPRIPEEPDVFVRRPSVSPRKLGARR